MENRDVHHDKTDFTQLINIIPADSSLTVRDTYINTSTPNSEDVITRNLAKLKEMGFHDHEDNKIILINNKLDITKTVQELLERT